MKKIVVAKYDSRWVDQFRELRNALLNYLKDDIIEIEHIGSTSIKGLRAKPIIDVDIIIEDDNEKMNLVISKLNELGYIHLGDLGIAGREAFNRKSVSIFNTSSNRSKFEHHLYLCKKGNLALENHIKFRNYLRLHLEDVIKYGKLKAQLALEYDIDSYCAGENKFYYRNIEKNWVFC